MLSQYIQAAMRRAKYKILEDDGTFFGEIPDCPGVWSNAPTLEECREELREVLEGWILLGIAHGHEIPVIDDIALTVSLAAQEVA